VRGCVVVGVDVVSGVVDPPPPAAAAMPTPLTPATAAEATTIAHRRMDIGESPFVRRALDWATLWREADHAEVNRGYRSAEIRLRGSAS
jgi:hypothetical protein